MRTFNYSAIKEQKWDSDVLGLIAAIYKEAGKQELYLKQRPEELEKLVEIAKIQASNAIEGIAFDASVLCILAISTSFSSSSGRCFKYSSCFPASLYIAAIRPRTSESHFCSLIVE